MATASLCRLIALLLPLAACLAWVGYLLRRYAALPPSLAVHFTLSGQPNGWMTPRSFALFTSTILLVVLGSTITMAANLPSTLFAHPLPPPASIANTLGIALAVGAFFEIVRLARLPSTRLSWSRILSWPAVLLSLQILFTTVALHA